MAIVESLLRLVTAILVISSGPVPDRAGDAVTSRVPKTMASAGGDAHGLVGVGWWQQGDNVPSDLPGPEAEPASPIEPVDAGVAEPLDNGSTVGESLDAAPLEVEPAAVEPLDVSLAVAEPAPAPAAAEVVSGHPPAKAPVAAAAAPAPVAKSQRKPSLPPDFGRGVTIVRNPTGGNTAEVPADCKQVLEHGRAVIGIGCGDDDGPSWLSKMGQSTPHTPKPGSRNKTSVSPPARSERSVIVTPPRSNDRIVRERKVIGHSTVTVAGKTTRVPNVSNVERITIDRSGGREIAVDRGGDGNREVVLGRGGRVSGPNQLTSAQVAKGTAKKNQGDKKNACTVAKQKAKAGASKQQLANLRAKCKRHKKADDRAGATLPALQHHLG
ncbi:MAG: hypothetical protein M3464_16020 [Chloroflexota bacterium]|nr:hypothetical protein [Chloroflexota bacterium]